MRVFGWTLKQGGVEHFRIREPLRGLRLRGHTVKTGKALSLDIANRFDVILVRGLHDHNSMLWRYLAKQGNHLLVYDLDDDIWNFHESTEPYRFWTKYRLTEAEENIRAASLVTTASNELATVLSELNPNVAVVPNTVPSWVVNYLNPPLKNFTVGWQGAASQHVEDMRYVLPQVLQFLILHPDVDLRIYGAGWIEVLEDLPKAVVDRITFFKFNPDIDAYYRSLFMHVGLAPLNPRVAFNWTKSGIRVQDYSSRGIVSLAQRMPCYDGYLLNGRNGLWIDNEKDWIVRLEELYDAQNLVRKMGLEARRMAQRWTTEWNAKGLEDLYASAYRISNARTRATKAG
jgi:hypothetical protein